MFYRFKKFADFLDGEKWIEKTKIKNRGKKKRNSLTSVLNKWMKSWFCGNSDVGKTVQPVRNISFIQSSWIKNRNRNECRREYSIEFEQIIKTS